ncbi:ribonuclease H-like domain-containing protein [Tanacetum coccineum]
MRTQSHGVDSLSFDDLYNNLRVFESDVKGSTASSSSQNVAFVSENTSSTNDVSTAYCVPNTSGQNSSFTRRLGILLESAESRKSRQQEEVAFGIQEPRMGSQNWTEEDSKAMVTIDGECIDWTNHSEDEDYAFDGLHNSTQTLRHISLGLKKVEAQFVSHSTRTTWTQTSESESQSSEFDTCESNISTEPSELVFEPVVNESNIACQPKVWSDAPIIEEYESDSEDDLNHLIRDCDFHEKRMARKAELNNGWNNVQRVNKQNQFVPSAVLTITGKIPVSTARARSTKILVQLGKVLTDRHEYWLGKMGNDVKSSAGCNGDHKDTTGHIISNTMVDQSLNLLHFQRIITRALKNKGNCYIVDVPRHMTGNKAYLLNFKTLMWSVVLEVVRLITGGLACLIAKATTDESNKWHRRLGHVNFKNLNKLVKGNLVRGLPSKIFKMATLVLVVRKESLSLRPPVCSFMLCDLDFEPLSLSLSSLPSCDLIDTEYGCALSMSVVPGLARDCLVIESRYKTYFVVVDAIILKLSYHKELYPSRSAFSSIRHYAIDQRAENAVSSKPDSFGYQIPMLMVPLVGSIVPLVKPLDIRKVDSSSYQALGACFNPYKAFMRRLEKTCVLRRQRKSELLLSEQLVQMIHFKFNTSPELYDFLAKWFVDEFPDFEDRVLDCNISSSKGMKRYSTLVVRICLFMLKEQILSWGHGHAVTTASAQNDNGSLEAESIVRAASTRVRFRLSTTPFCSGVRGVEV